MSYFLRTVVIKFLMSILGCGHLWLFLGDHITTHHTLLWSFLVRTDHMADLYTDVFLHFIFFF